MTSDVNDVCSMCGSKMTWEGFAQTLRQDENGDVVSDWTEFVLICSNGHDEVMKTEKVYGLPPLRMVGLFKDG